MYSSCCFFLICEIMGKRQSIMLRFQASVFFFFKSVHCFLQYDPLKTPAVNERRWRTRKVDNVAGWAIQKSVTPLVFFT